MLKDFDIGVDRFLKREVIVGYSGPGGHVVLPKGPCSVARGVFKDRDDITSLFVPVGYQRISANYFRELKSLREVEFEEGFRCIPGCILQYATSLVSVKLPESVRYIDRGAFANCRRLENLVLPAGVLEVDPDALIGIKSFVLAGEKIPRGLKLDGPRLYAPNVEFDSAKVASRFRMPLVTGRIELLMRGEVADFGESYRKYVRAQAPKVCEAMEYDPAVLKWMAAEGLFTKAAASAVAAECTHRGDVESAAVILEVARKG